MSILTKEDRKRWRDSIESAGARAWANRESIELALDTIDALEAERDQARELADFLEKKIEEVRAQRDLREEMASKLSGQLTDCFDVYRAAGVDVTGGLMATTRRVVERVQGGGE